MSANIKNMKIERSCQGCESRIKYRYANLIVTIIIIACIYQCNSQQTAPLSKVLNCLQFKNRVCVRCPQNTFLNQQQCYQNIQNCVEYQYGTASAICRQFKGQVIQNVSGAAGLNSLNNETTSTLIVKNSSYFAASTFSTTTSMAGSFGSSSSFTTSNYELSSNTQTSSQQIFRQLSLFQSTKDSYFLLCNNFMLRGQYSHFISRTTSNPVLSIYTYTSKGWKEYKILYQGSGGNLLQCLIGISTSTNSIILRSFVTIGRTQIIDYCVDYTSQHTCNRCGQGYHLDQFSDNGQKICVANIPGCLEYYGWICLKCRGYQYLVENRCVSECQALRDSRSVKCYMGVDLRNAKVVGSFGGLNVERSYFVG